MMKHRIGTMIALLSILAIFVGGLTVGGIVTKTTVAAPAASVPGFYREATVDAAKVVTVDVTTVLGPGWASADLVAFMVTCTEDSGTATLDIALQRSVDGGTTWANVVAMTQLAATGAETKIYSDLRASTAQFIGDRLRANYDVTGSGQYTCSVYLAGEG